MRKRFLLIAAALLLGSAGGTSAQTLKLMTGPQGGSWYPLGGAMKNIIEAAVPGASVQVLPVAGIILLALAPDLLARRTA